MSTLQKIRDRLITHAPIFNGRVSIARDINKLSPETLPEAWVHHWIDTASPQESFPFSSQAVERHVAILISAEAESDYSSGALDEARSGVLTALVENVLWINDFSFLSFVRLEIVDLTADSQSFRMVFKFTDYVRGQSS